MRIPSGTISPPIPDVNTAKQSSNFPSRPPRIHIRCTRTRPPEGQAFTARPDPPQGPGSFLARFCLCEFFSPAYKKNSGPTISCNPSRSCTITTQIRQRTAHDPSRIIKTNEISTGMEPTDASNSPLDATSVYKPSIMTTIDGQPANLTARRMSSPNEANTLPKRDEALTKSGSCGCPNKQWTLADLSRPEARGRS
jgi:hypothetical protein